MSNELSSGLHPRHEVFAREIKGSAYPADFSDPEAKAGKVPLQRGGLVEDLRFRGIFSRVSALTQRAYAAHLGQVIAVSRTVVAFLLLLFAVTGVPGASFPTRFDYLLLCSFAAAAGASLVISFRNWALDFSLSDVFIGVDVLVYAVFTAARTKLDSEVAILALCLMAHVLFVSVLRWRSGFAFVIAVFLNTFWIADILLFELPRGGLSQAGALRWCACAMIFTAVALWVSIYKLKPTLPRFAGSVAEPGLPSAVTAIGYAMEIAGARDAVLCWIDRNDHACYAVSPRTIEERCPPAKLGFSAAEGFKHLTPMLFEAKRGRAIISRDGDFTACTLSAVPGHALLAELDVQGGICIPVDGQEGRAWLILSGISMLGWGHLHLAEAICAEVSLGMAWQAASANDLNSALFRLRRTVACDLHDSVAHSLAGAKFLLVALRSKVGGEEQIVREIDTIKDALEAEHLHVRRLIEQLRETDTDAHARNLIDDIDAVGHALALRWQIEVEMRESDFRIQVPVWLSMEVQQIVREAISNGVRHGQASRIAIRCVRRSGMIEIEVTDNGTGFSDSGAAALPRSISERTRELGGKMKIESRPGCTTLKISIPPRAAD